MSRMTLMPLPLLLAFAPGGCPTLFEHQPPAGDVELPDSASYALANASAIRSALSDEIANVSPGTVVDPLDALDGCWASILSRPDSSRGLYQILSFDVAGQTFERISFIGVDGGGLLPSLPVISVERGTFETRGANVVVLRQTEFLANLDFDTAAVTTDLRVQPAPDEPIERVGLVTIDGERMQFWIDVESADEISLKQTPRGERPVFARFDCTN